MTTHRTPAKERRSAHTCADDDVTIGPYLNVPEIIVKRTRGLVTLQGPRRYNERRPRPSSA